MKQILVIDNYDSFTYNLVHLIKMSGAAAVTVLRNDEVQTGELAQYDKIVFSPGPGVPKEAGKMMELIRTYAGLKPMLGVCLGHQAIGEVFGSKLKNLNLVYHGMATNIYITDPDDYLFRNIPASFNAGRYHSWVIDETCLSPDLKITAIDENNLIMAVSHNRFDIKGVQFHPESVMTEYAGVLMRNWLEH